MWVRKSPEEIKQQHNRLKFAFGQPILFGVMIFAAALVAGLFPTGGYHRSTTPMSGPVPLLTALGVATLLGMLVAVGCYGWQLIWGRIVDDHPTWMCDRCHSVKHAGGTRGCSCGGMFDSIDNWKWVE